MKNFLLLNKKEGETPLEALGRFRRKHKEYKDEKITYAGRLDPLASGLLLVLAGDAKKEKEKYQGLSKEYEFEILFGFATDTHDILGKVSSVGTRDLDENELRQKIQNNLKYFTGSFEQEYPLYSSKTLKSARSGKKIKAPRHMVSVKSLKFLGLRKISSKTLLADIERRIGKVKGDFRQKEILKIWRILLKKSSAKFFVTSFHVKCGSGMYVRKIAHDLGGKVDVPALALAIRRTKIGKWE